MKRIIVGIIVIFLAFGIIFYASTVPSHNISLYPNDSQYIKLNSPVNIVTIKNQLTQIKLAVINGSISKIINETNEKILVILLNSTDGELVLLNNSSNATILKYSIDTLNTQTIVLFFISVIIFITGIIVILTELKRKKMKQ